MNAPSDPPQVHGDGLTPPSEGAGTQEALWAAEAPRCRWWLTTTEQCPEPFCPEHGRRFANYVQLCDIEVSGG